MNGLRLIFPRLGVVLVLAMSLALSGFAHKTAQAPVSADLQAYLAIGGTLDSICGAMGETGQTAPECEACRLADTVFTPGHMAHPAPISLPITCQMQRRALLRHHAKPRDPSHQTRAPPQA